MTAVLSLNSITGLDTAPTPDQSLFYLMAVVDDPRVFNDEMNFTGESSLQGFAHQADRRAAPPQVPTLAVNSIVGLDTAPTPDQSIFYLMATDDDPRSSGGKFIHSDRWANENSNYPPQIGGGFH